MHRGLVIGDVEAAGNPDPAGALHDRQPSTERRRRRESTQDIGKVVYVRYIDLSNLV